MMYHGGGMGVGWALIVFAVLLPTLVLLVAFAFGGFQRPAASAPARADAERVLADRFARGEIDREDYEERLHTLRSP